MNDYKELIERLRSARISPFDLGPVADAIESLLAENERLAHNLVTTEQTMREYQELAAKRLEEIERLKTLEESALKVCAELDSIVMVMPYDYLDPPDGGNVPMNEQISRMWSEVKELRAERDICHAECIKLTNEYNSQLAEKDEVIAEAGEMLAMRDRQLAALKTELREICAAIDDSACDLTLTAVECIKKLKAENECDELRAKLDSASKVVAALVQVARAAWHAADDSEEVLTDDGRAHRIIGPDFDALSDALDALDELPDDQPGYVMNGPARAEWALRNLLCSAT